MRGLQVRVSLSVFLDVVGIDSKNIQLGAVAVDAYQPDVMMLVLRGENKQLPKVAPGAPYPRGTIVCERDPSRAGIRGKLVTEAK